MRPFIRTWTSAFILAWAGVAYAHKAGFHKKTHLTVSAYAVEALLTLDVDEGAAAELLRQGADVNRDGQLTGHELEGLKTRLAGMATRGLKVKVGGLSIPFAAQETKLSVRDDATTSRAGLSVAVWALSEHPWAVGEGAWLELQDTSPDFSHVAFDIALLTAADAGGGSSSETREAASGEKVRLRLSTLRRR